MMQPRQDEIIIAGGGIGGLTLALSLHAAGLGQHVRLFEAVRDFRPVGGGINLGPHAMKVFWALGLGEQLVAVSKQPEDYAFFTRHGQLVYREPWGRAAGHQWPHISVHRAELHKVLMQAVTERIGAEHIHLGWRCGDFSQTGSGVSVDFADTETGERRTQTGGVLIGCDGIHSVVRKSLYPDEGPPRFHGINLWRGVALHKPFLTGASIARIGAMHTTIIIYPICDNADGQGNQLVNWVAEVDSDAAVPVDWNGAANLDDFIGKYEDWRFDWIDVASLIRGTNHILAYPMVDRDPLPRWTFDRVTLLGDAAHPMFPRGGNGGAQSILDASALARHLQNSSGDFAAALQSYEAERRPATTEVVLKNRSSPPNVIVDTVEKLTEGQTFTRIEDVISAEKLREIFASYQKVAGYHIELVGKTSTP